MATLNEMRRAKSLGVAYANVKRKTRYVPSESIVASYRPTRYTQEESSLQMAQIGAGEGLGDGDGGSGGAGVQKLGLGIIPAVINELRKKSGGRLPEQLIKDTSNLIDIPTTYDIPNIMNMPTPSTEEPPQPKRRLLLKKRSSMVEEPLEPSIPSTEEPPKNIVEKVIAESEKKAVEPYYPYESEQSVAESVETPSEVETPFGTKPYEPQFGKSLSGKSEKMVMEPEQSEADYKETFIKSRKKFNRLLENVDSKLSGTSLYEALKSIPKVVKNKILGSTRLASVQYAGGYNPKEFTEHMRDDIKMIAEKSPKGLAEEMTLQYYKEALKRLEFRINDDKATPIQKNRLYNHYIPILADQLRSAYINVAQKHGSSGDTAITNLTEELRQTPLKY